MTRYLLVEGPSHTKAPDWTLLTGYYEAVFEDDGGVRHARFLTDKGRAEVVRRQGEDQLSFSPEEIERWTVEPDVQTVIERYEAEAGEGA
jgi:hypothetical protein